VAVLFRSSFGNQTRKTQLSVTGDLRLAPCLIVQALAFNSKPIVRVV